MEFINKIIQESFNDILQESFNDILQEELKSSSDKGNRYFEMLKTGKFQHYDSPKGELSTFSKGEEDRKRLVSKLSKADKKQYREWLKTPEGQESLNNFISEQILFLENVQLADKIYFNNGKLSQKDKEKIIKITKGDVWTKLLTDVYYYFFIENHEKYDSEKLIQVYNQFKQYNKNIFPIKGFNINGIADNDIYGLIHALLHREKIIEDFKSLPSVAARNMKNDIRQPRDNFDMDAYRDSLEYFLSYYSMLSNRDPRLRKNIENKMFKTNVTLDELLHFVEEKENLVGGKKFTKNIISNLVKENSYDMNIVFNSGNVMVVDVQTPESIKKIGCNSLWCFTYGKGFENAYRDWNNYSTNNHVYVIIDFSEQSDSPEFMHVLIKPLDYNEQSENNDGDVNDSKLFNMTNEESYNAINIINHLVGEQAPYIMNFDEPVNVKGPSSAWPYQNPNQTKLDLKEIKNKIEQILSEAKKRKSRFERLKDKKIPLTDEEREKVMKAKAVWHFSPGNKPSPAVWKSKDSKGNVVYVSNTHRAFQSRTTLQAAINVFHDFIKGTA